MKLVRNRIFTVTADRPRSATVTAATDLVCHGLTCWEFRQVIQRNGTIAWELLQALAKQLRAADPK